MDWIQRSTRGFWKGASLPLTTCISRSSLSWTHWPLSGKFVYSSSSTSCLVPSFPGSRCSYGRKITRLLQYYWKRDQVIPMAFALAVKVDCSVRGFPFWNSLLFNSTHKRTIEDLDHSQPAESKTSSLTEYRKHWNRLGATWTEGTRFFRNSAIWLFHKFVEGKKDRLNRSLRAANSTRSPCTVTW